MILRVGIIGPWHCVSKKWHKATFPSFSNDGLSLTLPGGHIRKVRNPADFIRFDVHAAEAGLNLRGCGPLTTPGFVDGLTVSPVMRRRAA